jgi:glucokinase
VAHYIGIDIGGTKCAVSLGDIEGRDINIVDKSKFSTIPNKPYEVLDAFINEINNILSKNSIPLSDIKGLGISCGSPLNSKTGVIMSPPNLIGWDNIPVVEFFESRLKVKSYLQNDANACAVAEWRYGAGAGYENVIFLTFGTGFGSGLILNNKLYAGSTDMAGEIGHVRLTENGPVGYGKAGSAEGYCSGSGLKRIAAAMVEAETQMGRRPLLLEKAGTPDNIDAKLIADLADNDNDPLCIEVYRIAGEKLGHAVSVLSDLFDPDVIIIGSIYVRSANLLEDAMRKVIDREALNKCKIAPAKLGEKVGDYAALSLATGDFYG